MNSDVGRAAGAALRIGDVAPNFQARTTQGPVTLSDYRGRWLVFFSHPADFTPVCTTEFVSLAREAGRFEALNCALLGLSVDSLYAHLAWLKAIREVFDIVIPFPIIEDPSMVIGRAYGMVDDSAVDSTAVRAAYFIDPQGVIRAQTWYPHTVGRSVDEILRMIAALQATQDGEGVAPANWQPGEGLLEPSVDGATGADVAQDWFCREVVRR